MKKGILMGIAMATSVVALTGCSTSTTQKLTCTQNSTYDGYTDEVSKKIDFKDYKITKITEKRVIKLSGDKVQYFNDYKTSSESTVERYKTISGIDAKSTTNGTSDVTTTITYNPDKMSANDKELNGLNENYDSIKDKLTKQGYTCK